MDDLKEYLEYREGNLFWKKSPARRIRVGSEAGCLDSKGYKFFGFRGKLYRTHRVIYFLFHGTWPKVVDHIDGNRINNLIENLRAATNQENLRNMKSHGGSSRFKGVSYRPRNKNKKYEAQIMIDRKYLHLGSFVNEEEAAKAYDEAAVKYFGDFAKLNFKRD